MMVDDRKQIIEDGVFEEKYYSCAYCDVPDVFETIEGVREHQKTCIQNLENVSCATCKHLEVIKEAPYPRLAKDKEDMQLKSWLGSYMQGYCGKKKKKLYERDFFKKYKCYEQCDPNEEVVKHYTEDYKKFLHMQKDYMKAADRETMEEVEVIEGDET